MHVSGLLLWFFFVTAIDASYDHAAFYLSASGVGHKVHSYCLAVSSSPAGHSLQAAVLGSRDGSDITNAVTGLYIYGSVGSGKSLLMDMFFRVLHQHNAVPRRRRVHFNAAMLEVGVVASSFLAGRMEFQIDETLQVCQSS